MYKRQSPEALHLATLGRADSKRPETTCRGITTAGRACRKALKKGSREKYCHWHVDQETTYRSRLLKGKLTTVTIVEEEEEEEEETAIGGAKTEVKNGYVTPAASPKRLSPVRKPVPSSAMYTPAAALRPPSLQLSPGPSIPPPTPPHSIHSPTPPSDAKDPPKEMKKAFKLGKAFRKLFIHDPPKQMSTTAHPSHGPSILPVDLRRNDLYPSRYPPGIIPSPPRPTAPPSPPMHAPIPPFHKHQMAVHLPLKPKLKVPQIQGRPPTAVLACAQSRSLTTGIQRSWETMWVPGINNEGAHIICKEWLSPKLSPAGSQKILNCMRAPLSVGEDPGYIYVYKISEHSSKEEVYYKVGRAQNLTRRLYQWSRSCPYTPLLVEFFPSPPPTHPKSDPNVSGPVVKCAVSHRVERLIHLELEDRFGRVDLSRQGCKCGKVHKEWFRGGSGGWTEVRDVIIRWVGFAKVAYGEVPA